ncbi:MAG: GHKL domain-containing protein [Raoultibacter sp.]
MELEFVCVAMMTVYNCLVMDYCSKILETRLPKIIVFALLPLLAALLFLVPIALDVLIPLIYALEFAVTFLVIRISFYGRFIHMFWAALNFTFHTLVIRGIVLAIASLAANLNMYRVIEDGLLNMLTLIATFFVLCLFLVVFNAKVDVPKVKILLSNPGQLKFVYMLQLVMLGFLLFCTYAYYYNLDLVWFTIFHLLTCVFVLIGYYIAFGMAVRTAVWVEDELNYQIVEAQMQRQIRGYEEQKKLYDLMRQYKHDFKRILNTANGLLATGNVEEAQELLGETVTYADVNLAPRPEYSNILIVDIVLDELADNCDKNDIELSAQCFISEDVTLTSLQLCRMFNNLAANALEACQRQAEGSKRWIDIKGRLQKDKSVIVMRNSFDGKVVMAGENELATRKTNKEYHGLGVRNIKAIVEKNQGFSEITISKNPNVFEFFIALPLQEKQGEE